MRRVNINGIDLDIPEDMTADQAIGDDTIRNRANVSPDDIIIERGEGGNEVLQGKDPVAGRHLFTLPRYQSA